MTERKNTANLRETNDKVKRAAETIQWNLAHPGRPSKFHEGFCHLAEKTSSIGSTNADLAELFGVVESTISGWMTSFSAFNSAIRRGRARADDRVEEALLNRAIGYSHLAVKIFIHEGTPLVVPYTERYPPDTRAIAFWLRNRRPNQWRNRVNAPGATPEDAARLLREQVADMDKVTAREN